jgi:hypothetical protein
LVLREGITVNAQFMRFKGWVVTKLAISNAAGIAEAVAACDEGI